MQSIFIGAVPRSFSSKTVGLIRRSTDLETPCWTSDGEILNADRMSFSSGIGASGERFLPFSEAADTNPGEPDRAFGDDHSARASRLLAYLEDVVQETGHLYKDVVQPFIVAKFMERTALNTLYLNRPLTDVVYLMRKRDWFFPTNAVAEDRSRLEALILGLSRAQSRLREAADAVVEFDDIVHEFDTTKDVLQNWYSDRSFETPRTDTGDPYYEDPTFEEERDRRLDFRETDKYQRLGERVTQVVD